MRRFNFYEREPVKAPALQVLDITCAASGRGSLTFGDSEGHILMLDRNYRATGFQAHKTRVNAICQLRNSPVLVTVGDGADARPTHVRNAARAAVLNARERAGREAEQALADALSQREDGEEDREEGESSSGDIGLRLGLGFPLEGVASALQRGDATWEGGAALTAQGPPQAGGKGDAEGPVAVLKVWRLDRRDPRTGIPECARTCRVFASNPKESATRERVVTCLAVAEDCSQVAIGCGDGAVVLLRGDLLKGDRAGGRTAKRGLVSFNLGLGGGGSGAQSLKAQLLYDPPGSLEASAQAAAEEGAAGVTGEAVTALLYSVHAGDPSVGSTLAATATTESKGSSAGGGQGASFGASGGGQGARRSRPMLCLYATTAHNVRCYFPTEVRPPGMGRGWGAGEAYLELGSPGCAPGCAALGNSAAGAGSGSTAVSQGQELVVGNEQGVYFYSPDERKGAYTLPGKKQRVAWFRGCLLCATEEGGGATAARVTLTIYDLRSKFVAYTMSLGAAGGAAVKAIGASSSAQGGSSSGGGGAPAVRAVLPEWGQLFVLLSSEAGGALAIPSLPSGFPSGGPLTALSLLEKDTASKVDTLCRLSLFDTALGVAQASNYSAAELADIHRAQGDHLYGRAEYDGATAAYCRTIGHVEPSYVIRRYLDSARVGNLASYLEALHAQGAASSDHTTLLLNCYTKMGVQEKLRSFIRGQQHAGAAQAQAQAKGGASASSEPTFDVRVAISVLRDAGCVEEATWLAEAHGEHDLYLALLLLPGSGGTGALNAQPVAFPPPSPQGALVALSFLKRLPFLDAEFYARRYGRLLLAAAPRESVDFLVSLSIKWVRAKPHVQGSAERPGGLTTLVSLGLAGGDDALRVRNRCEDVSTLLPLFADYPGQLKAFLERVVALAAQGEAYPPGPPVWHALLDVCLRRDVYKEEGRGALEGVELTRAQDEAVITGVLRNPAALYDPATALVLCQAWSYRPGCLVLYERLGLKHLVLAHYMETAEGARATGRHAESKAARREMVRRVKAMTEPGQAEGSLGPARAVKGAHSIALPEGDEGGVQAAGLWVAVLRYLSRSYLDSTGHAVLPAAGAGQDLTPGAPLPGDETTTVRASYPGLTGATLVREREEQDALLGDVLRHLEKATSTGGHLAGALPPLTVLSVLSECPHLPFSLCRDFLVRRLSGEAEVAAEEGRVLTELRQDTELLQGEIKRLETQPVVFQSRTCKLCGLELDLPSVHFLCGGGPRLGSYRAGGAAGGGGAGGEEGGLAGGKGKEEHTFHLHCVTEALSSNLGLGGGGGRDAGEGHELECPLCAGEQHRVVAIMQALGPKPGLAEQFFTSLEAAPDGFLKAAEFLGKGLYSGQGGRGEE